MNNRTRYPAVLIEPSSNNTSAAVNFLISLSSLILLYLTFLLLFLFFTFLFTVVCFSWLALEFILYLFILFFFLLNHLWNDDFFIPFIHLLIFNLINSVWFFLNVNLIFFSLIQVYGFLPIYATALQELNVFFLVIIYSLFFTHKNIYDDDIRKKYIFWGEEMKQILGHWVLSKNESSLNYSIDVNICLTL